MDRATKLCLVAIIVLASFVGVAKAEGATTENFEYKLHEPFEFSVGVDWFQSLQGKRLGFYLGPSYEIASRINLGFMLGVQSGPSGKFNDFSNVTFRTHLSYAWNEKLGLATQVRGVVNGEDRHVGLFGGIELRARKTHSDVFHFILMIGFVSNAKAAVLGELRWSFH